MSGLRVRIRIPEDHVVKLPDEVPYAPVELFEALERALNER